MFLGNACQCEQKCMLSYKPSLFLFLCKDVCRARSSAAVGNFFFICFVCYSDVWNLIVRMDNTKMISYVLNTWQNKHPVSCINAWRTLIYFVRVINILLPGKRAQTPAILKILKEPNISGNFSHSRFIFFFFFFFGQYTKSNLVFGVSIAFIEFCLWLQESFYMLIRFSDLLLWLLCNSNSIILQKQKKKKKKSCWQPVDKTSHQTYEKLYANLTTRFSEIYLLTA